MLRDAGRWLRYGAIAFFMCTAHAQPPQERLAACAACHGADGNSTKAGVPSIAGQPKIYLENYLVLTREGLRGDDEMRKLLLGVKDPEIIALANYYTALPPRPETGPGDSALLKRGRQVAQQNRCGICHRPDFRGQQQMPRLAGQREDFLFHIMIAYQRNRVPGGDTMMAAVLYGIPEEDVKALAHFLARSR